MTAEHVLSSDAVADPPWRQADLKVNGVQIEWGESVVLHQGAENTVTVEVSDEIATEIGLRLIDDEKLIDGVEPDEEWSSPEGRKFTWKIKTATGRSGRITLILISRQVNVPWVIPCWVMSKSLEDYFIAKIDGEDIPAFGLTFLSGKPRTLTLAAKSGSPIEGKPIWLKWISGEWLPPEAFEVNPGWGVPQTEYKWIINARLGGNGTFTLALQTSGVPKSYTLGPWRVESETQYKILINRQEHDPTAPIYPVRDQPMDITLIPKTPSQSYVSLQLKEYFGSSGSIPPAETPVMVDTDGHTWKFTLYGSDKIFMLGFTTRPKIELNMFPGYHDKTLISLSSIVKSQAPEDPDLWVLLVKALRSPVNAGTGVRVGWRRNGVLVADRYTLYDGYSALRVKKSEAGQYSAELYERAEPYGLKYINV